MIAALRALGELFGDEIADQDLPSVALAAERNELGITAGLGDRVVQTYGGLVYLDLAREGGPRVEPLDAGAPSRSLRRVAARRSDRTRATSTARCAPASRRASPRS